MVEREPRTRLSSESPVTAGVKWGKIELRQGGTVNVIGTPHEGLVHDQVMQGFGVDRAGLELVTVVTSRIRSAMATVIEGKPEIIDTAITVLLAEGHLLIEDVHGVGKTMLAKALAKSVDCSVRLVQFTPDLLPSDITVVSVFNQDLRYF